MSQPQDCYQAITHLDEAMLTVTHGATYYVLGGIASAAIKHPDTLFDHDSRVVHAAEDSGDTILRPNGTRRDVDILVDDVLTEEAASKIKDEVTRAIGGSLVVSVFGFDRHMPSNALLERAKGTVGSFMSKRTVDENGVRRYELYPLSQTVNSASYIPWQLRMPTGAEVSVMNPAGHVLAYAMRSISGIRAKDVVKLNEMFNVIQADPTFIESVTNGTFKEWLAFACGVYDLRDGHMPINSRILEPQTNKTEMAAFSAKGRVLRWLEGQQGIVDFAQRESIQRILNVFVRAA